MVLLLAYLLGKGQRACWFQNWSVTSVTVVAMKLDTAEAERALEALVSLCRAEHAREHPGWSDALAGEIRRQCGARWAAMTEAEAVPFLRRAAGDRAGQVVAEERAGQAGAQRKKKTVVSGYLTFCRETRQQVCSELPPGVGNAEIQKEVGRRWSELAAGHKAGYRARAGEGKSETGPCMDVDMGGPVPQKKSEDLVKQTAKVSIATSLPQKPNAKKPEAKKPKKVKKVKKRKPPSGYSMFIRSERRRVTKERPELLMAEVCREVRPLHSALQNILQDLNRTVRLSDRQTGRPDPQSDGQ
jgi:hypothetical protein